MATTRQSKKRMRQNHKLRLHNRGVRADLRTHIKRYRDAIAEGAENAGELLARAESKIDKAAKRRIIPPGRANRIKRRLKLLTTVKG